MVLVEMPSIALHWSEDHLYSCNIRNIMSRNRSELLLSRFHCCNNNAAVPGERFFKIKGLIYDDVSNLKGFPTPEDIICIDETVVPFLGSVIS